MDIPETGKCNLGYLAWTGGYTICSLDYLI
jgi:hypothetical protein